jgi:hypothetical protein
MVLSKKNCNYFENTFKSHFFKNNLKFNKIIFFQKYFKGFFQNIPIILLTYSKISNHLKGLGAFLLRLMDPSKN